MSHPLRPVNHAAPGIAKFTPPTHPDHAAIEQFAKGINSLLSNINNRLKKNEERLSLLSLYHEISQAPVRLQHPSVLSYVLPLHP